MTTTKKDLLSALATLLGATTYNGCLDARIPSVAPKTPLITASTYPTRKSRLT